MAGPASIRYPRRFIPSSSFQREIYSFLNPPEPEGIEVSGGDPRPRGFPFRRAGPGPAMAGRGRDCGSEGKGTRKKGTREKGRRKRVKRRETRDEKQGITALLRAGSTPGGLPGLGGSARGGPGCP